MSLAKGEWQKHCPKFGGLSSAGRAGVEAAPAELAHSRYMAGPGVPWAPLGALSSLES